MTATTGEEPTETAGISSRTLWRHFPTEESGVRPRSPRAWTT
ncbi:hypothetical protein M4J07_004857 [Streptomyces longispororuber]|nr:hypothetical protein [Streptomyces longispororuber]